MAVPGGRRPAAGGPERPPVDEWKLSVYGEPCLGCAFSWGIGVDDAVLLVSSLPGSFTELLAGATGHERHPELAWPVASYVCHIGDNLRIWAERLAGIARGAPREVGGYDENLLAKARCYEMIPLEAALWTMTRAAVEWRVAVGLSASDGVVLDHPERGLQTLADVAVANAHDAFHHRWDIERSLQAAAG